MNLDKGQQIMLYFNFIQKSFKTRNSDFNFCA